LPFDEVTVRHGIPTTTVPRTILDQAATATTRQVERLVNEADVQQLWDRLCLDDLLDRYPRRAGSAAVRAALRGRRAGATVTRSELEEMFMEFVDDLGLARPESNVPLGVGATLFEGDCDGGAQTSWSSWTVGGFTTHARHSGRTGSVTAG
jgi:hypothetical protein